jgi:tetratricopeptide (TPR) repeat protein
VKLVIKIIAVLLVLLVVVVFIFVLLRYAPYYYQKASVKMAKGDFVGALADYNKAIKLKPDYVDAYLGQGGAEYKKGDPEGALADYNKAIELKPDLNQIPDLAQTPEAIVTNEIASQALTLFKAKDYDKLDDLAAKLRSSKESYADGVWKLNCVYSGLVPMIHASDEEWETRVTDISLWAVARPESITPQVAWANVLVAYAWKARGAGEVNTVSPEGWWLFRQRLMEAARVLAEAKTLKEKCPLYWRVLMRDALGLQVDETRFDAIFDEAIKFEPDFENYYVGRLIYLLPRWYGKAGEWQSDLTKSADKIGGENGDMLYAQVIWNMNETYYSENLFMENNVSWTRVDKGFEVIEKKFPDSLAVKIERAQLAILFNDAQALACCISGYNKQTKSEWDAAISDYDKAISLKTNYAEAYGHRGFAKHGKGDLKGAMADYNIALEMDPKSAGSYYNRGRTEAELNNYDGAMADFNKAIELEPDFARVYSARGSLKLNKGNQAGAMADFNQAVRLMNPQR